MHTEPAVARFVLTNGVRTDHVEQSLGTLGVTRPHGTVVVPFVPGP